MYSAWAIKKRFMTLFLLGAIGLSAFAAYVFISMYQPPSCYDNKLNQDEIGIDCGGMCSLMCSSQINPLNTVWTRVFEIREGMWSAISYTENPNPEAYSKEANYVFSLYDRDVVLLKEVHGSTYITHDPVLPVFHGRIEIEGTDKPYRTVFKWENEPDWYRVDDVYDLIVQEQKYTYTQNGPEVSASLINQQPRAIKDIEVVAIVYGADKNAIAASKTYVDYLPARGKREITFSWINPFATSIERIEIIPRVPLQEVN